jgi:hypothetical protein
MKKIVGLLIVTITAHGLLQAMRDCRTLYKNIPITRENLLNLVPPVPDDVQADLKQWISQHPGILEKLLHRRSTVSQARKEHVENRTFLEDKDICNYSTWNYAIPLTHQYFIKISGPVNRAATIKACHDKSYETHTPSEWDALEVCPTVQTISSAAYSLRLREAIENYELAPFIKTPPTYLVPMPGKPTELCDENYLIVQQSCQNLTLLKSQSPTILELDEHRLAQILCAIKYTGLWNLSGNVMTGPDKSWEFPDLEQPGNSAPQDFFHKNLTRYNGNVFVGISELADTIDKESPQGRLLFELLEQDSDLPASSYYGDLLTYCRPTKK